MKPLIATPDDAARLRTIAASWLGTPWVGGASIKGTGASCTGLPYGVLAEFGHAAPVPPARLDVLKRDIVSVCEQWLLTHPEHYLQVGRPEIAAGDVLLFDLGIGHMALCLGGTEMLHSWQSVGAHYANFAEARLSVRLLSAWRPIVTS
jgi:cell wall-associated NlpC family hydrolase